MGSNREKSNIAIAILDKWGIRTYPISHFNCTWENWGTMQTEDLPTFCKINC